MSGGEIEMLPDEPEDPGTELSQSQPTAEEMAALARRPIRGGLTPYPVTESIRRLHEQGVRGQAGMVLLISSVESLEEQIRQLRGERDKATEQRDDFREKLHDCVSVNKVLRERIKSGVKLSYFQNVANTLGSILLGVTVPVLVTGFSGGGSTAFLLGACLLAMGWFPSNPSSEVE